MNRYKAAAVHLAISAALATAVISLLYFLWFPQPYFIAAGATRLVVILMGVDVGIGPLLTLIVVSPKKSKRLLKLDLLVIATLQFSALVYGVHIIAQSRPVFLVAEIDRLVLVSAGDLSDTDLAQGSTSVFRTRSWRGPVLVGALPPTGNAGIDLTTHTISDGKDIDRMPKFYVPYDQVIDKVMLRARELSKLKTTSDSELRQLNEVSEADRSTVLALPIQRGEQSSTAIMSKQTKRPVAILGIDPW